MSPLRVVLVDDHDLVRAGIRALIDRMEFAQVVAEGGNGLAALRLVEQFQPDIVLMDISMPEMNGLQATERISADFPHIHVLILSVHHQPEYRKSARNAGASGYLVKDAAASELGVALKEIAESGQYTGARLRNFT